MFCLQFVSVSLSVLVCNYNFFGTFLGHSAERRSLSSQVSGLVCVTSHPLSSESLKLESS